jgi:tetratricopeptide (TPR) repeat protein
MSTQIELSWIPTEPNPDLTPEQNDRLVAAAHQLVTEGYENLVEPGDAVGLGQSYFDALQEMAVRYYRSQRYDDAAVLYQRLLQLKPMQLDYYKGLGACYLGQQRYDAAVRAYESASFFDALDAELHYYMGLAYYFQKKFEPAFDVMRFARVLDERAANPDSKIAAFATQMLERMKPLVSPEQAALIDKRPD